MVPTGLLLLGNPSAVGVVLWTKSTQVKPGGETTELLSAFFWAGVGLDISVSLYVLICECVSMLSMEGPYENTLILGK